jgi:hypothetical protein
MDDDGGRLPKDDGHDYLAPARSGRNGQTQGGIGRI